MDKSLFWWVVYGGIVSAIVSLLDMYFEWGIFPM